MTWERGQTDEDMHTVQPQTGFCCREYVLGSSCYFYLGRPGGTGSDSFQINNYLNQNPGGGIANHHAFELVSKSQPLKLNNERALTPAVHWHIRLADTVLFRV